MCAADFSVICKLFVLAKPVPPRFIPITSLSSNFLFVNGQIIVALTEFLKASSEHTLASVAPGDRIATSFVLLEIGSPDIAQQKFDFASTAA